MAKSCASTAETTILCQRGKISKQLGFSQYKTEPRTPQRKLVVFILAVNYTRIQERDEQEETERERGDIEQDITFFHGPCRGNVLTRIAKMLLEGVDERPFHGVAVRFMRGVGAWCLSGVRLGPMAFGKGILPVWCR